MPSILTDPIPGSEISFSVKLDQSKANNYKASDLLAADTRAVTAPLVDLQFQHILCKVEISLDSSFGTVSSIDLTGFEQCAFDLNTFEIRSTGDPTVVRMAPTGTPLRYEAVIPVMTVPEGVTMAVIHTSRGDVVWDMENDTEFHTGYSYSFSLVRSSVTSKAKAASVVETKW